MGRLLALLVLVLPVLVLRLELLVRRMLRLVRLLMVRLGMLRVEVVLQLVLLLLLLVMVEILRLVLLGSVLRLMLLGLGVMDLGELVLVLLVLLMRLVLLRLVLEVVCLLLVRLVLVVLVLILTLRRLLGRYQDRREGLMSLVSGICLTDRRPLLAYVSLVGGVREMRLVSRRHLILRQVMVRDLVVRQGVVRPLMVLWLVRLSRLMGYRSVVRIWTLAIRKLGVSRVGTRIAALLDLKLLCRIPLLRLLMIRGIWGRTVLWRERRLVVVGLVEFGLVRSSRLGH